MNALQSAPLNYSLCGVQHEQGLGIDNSGHRQPCRHRSLGARAVADDLFRGEQAMTYDTVWLLGTCAIYALMVWAITNFSSNANDDET